MQRRNFFTHLRFILAVFKQIRASVKFYFARDIIENSGIIKITRKNWFIINLKTLLQIFLRLLPPRVTKPPGAEFCSKIKQQYSFENP